MINLADNILNCPSVEMSCMCSNFMNGKWGNCGTDYKGLPICYVVEPSNCSDLQYSSSTGKYYSWAACISK